MAAAAAQAGVAVGSVCWWFQSGYEVAEGGDRLAWSTGLHSATSAAAFMAFFMLNALECTIITAARDVAAAPGPGPQAANAQPPPVATRQDAGTAADADVDSIDHSPPSLHHAAANHSSTSSADHGAADSCMRFMHTPISPQPTHTRPRLSCGVGRSCDAEAAAAGMLRRLVRSYEGVLPRRRMCRVLRDFVALMQRFAASNAADTPQEHYPPAVHITHRSGSEASGEAAQEVGQAACGMHEEADTEGDADVVATVPVPLDPIACVVGTLVATAIKIQAKLQQQGAEDSARRGVDLEALRARGRGRVVEGGVNLFLIQSHMRRCVLREMLEKRACMDGSLCLLEDRNVAVCSLLDASPAQAAAAEGLWEEWRRHRRAQDGRLAAALRVLAALPTPAAIPTAFLRHLSAVAEGAAAAGTKRSRSGGSTAAAEEVAGLAEAVVGASGGASEAGRGLLAASAEEKANLAEFLGRVWLPSDAVDDWGMVAVWASSLKVCALCDMLRVLQLLAQQRQRQRLEGAMEELTVGPGTERPPGSLLTQDCAPPPERTNGHLGGMVPQEAGGGV